MSAQINDLVAMRDVETLYELMTEDEDWLTQFDAAEGLVKLGDKRGYEFITTAVLSDDDEILEVAKEIRESPEFKKLQRELETERAHEKRARVESAKKRLQKGGRVWRYKMLHLASGALIGDDPLGKGFEIPALDDLGLEGWEIVHILPVRRTLLSTHADEHMTGAYFLLKREVLPTESAELDSN